MSRGPGVEAPGVCAEGGKLSLAEQYLPACPAGRGSILKRAQPPHSPRAPLPSPSSPGPPHPDRAHLGFSPRFSCALSTIHILGLGNSFSDEPNYLRGRVAKAHPNISAKSCVVSVGLRRCAGHCETCTELTVRWGTAQGR